MASLSDVDRVADDLETLVGEMRSELKRGPDFGKLMRIADEISEHADNAAETFNSMNETLMARLEEIRGGKKSAGCFRAVQQPLNDLVQLEGNIRVDGADRRRLAVEHGIQRQTPGFSRERLLSGNHFIQHRAEREQIARRIERLSPHLLGRHVIHAANRGSGTG